MVTTRIRALEQVFGKRFSVDMYYLAAVLHYILGLNWLHFIWGAILANLKISETCMGIKTYIFTVLKVLCAILPMV